MKVTFKGDVESFSWTIFKRVETLSTLFDNNYFQDLQKQYFAKIFLTVRNQELVLV